MTGVGTGVAWFLAVVLAVAAVLKVRDLPASRQSLGRLLAGRRPRRRILSAAVVTLSFGELLLAGALGFAPRSTIVAGATAAVFVGFVAVVLRAHALGTACGCFGSLSLRTSGRAEIVRAVVLAALAVGLLASRLLPVGGDHVAVSVTTAAALVVAGYLASRAGVAQRPPATWTPVDRRRRREILERVRGDRDVQSVAVQLGGPLDWGSAVVLSLRQDPRMCTISIGDDERRLNVMLAASGRPAAIGRTADGRVIVPELPRITVPSPPA